MSKKTDALKAVAVAMGYGSNVSEYTGHTVAHILKEIAVKMQCAESVEAIEANAIADVLKYIADNYGTEEVEPFDLTTTLTHATVVMKRNGKTVTAGKDRLYNGDKVKFTVTAAEGYEITTLTVNGTAYVSGIDYVVNGHNVTLVATGTLKTYDLARTVDEHVTVAVTKGGNAVSDGTDVLTHGDVLTITATAGEGYELDTLTVNGTAFESGTTLTVDKDVTIVATSKEETEEVTE